MNKIHKGLASTFILGVSALAQAELALIDDENLSNVSGQANINNTVLENLSTGLPGEDLSLETFQQSNTFQGMPSDIQNYISENFNELKNMSAEDRMNTMASQMTFESFSTSDMFKNMPSDQQSFIENNFDNLKGMPMGERMETMQAQGFTLPQGGMGSMMELMQGRQ